MFVEITNADEAIEYYKAGALYVAICTTFGEGLGKCEYSEYTAPIDAWWVPRRGSGFTYHGGCKYAIFSEE